MQVKNSYLIFCLSFILLTLPACSVSMTTANISSLKLGKDKSVSQETATFETGDGIYAAAVVSNVPSAVKVKARLLVDDVPGQEKGPIPNLEQTLDMTSSGTATFSYAPPTAGWPKGKYTVEILMLDDTGAQKDQKTASFTVS